MDAYSDPNLALNFRLVAHFEPGTRVLAASDWYGPEAVYRSAISDMERELPGAWDGVLLTHPQSATDIFVEALDGPNRYGYLEHHRHLGSRYYEASATSLELRGHYGEEALPAVSRARVQQRLDQLQAEGWRQVPTGPEPPVFDDGVRNVGRYVTAATAEAVAAMLACHSPFEAAQAVSYAQRDSLVYEDPVRDELWRWTLAWSGEQLGLDGAAQARKASEHRLWVLDAGLVGTYHRRAAVQDLHQAMAGACAQRLPLVMTNGLSESSARSLARQLEEQLGLLWGPHVDTVSVLGHFDRLADARGAGTGRDLGAIEVDMADQVHTVEMLAPQVAPLRHATAIGLLEAVGPDVAPATGPKPWVQEPHRAELPMTAGGREWRAWAERGKNSHWRAYVALPEEHPWIGRDLRDPLLEAIPVHTGLSFAGPKGGTWVVGFDCYRPGRGDRNTADFLDLAYAQGQTRTLVAHAALADLAAARTAPEPREALRSPQPRQRGGQRAPARPRRR
jgi:hypothetical protein